MRHPFLRRILALGLSALLAVPALAAPAPAAGGGSPGLLERLLKTGAEQEQEDILLIVEVEGEPACSAYGVQLLDADAQQARQRRNLQAQALVREKIQNVVEIPAEAEQVYTNVLNGFSIRVGSAAEIEKIRAIPGVKSVSVSRTFKVPEPIEGEADPAYGARLATSAGLIGADKLAESGYNGEGQVVAIIDSELDIDHDFFSQEPENPKYSKEDMAQLLARDDMHFQLQGRVDEVYKSAKIPFAYDYTKNSPDVYDTTNIHGTHVSGIAAGKGGVGPDGKTGFSGVAPEAQIIFMKAFDGARAQEAIIIQAIDDAAKLGVSAINMSLGADYVMSGNNPAFETAIENARGAGIFVACAVGNATFGYKDGAVLTENIEYSAGGTPAGYSAATSVAGSANSSIWLNKFLLEDGTEVPFTEGSGANTFASAFSDQDYPYVFAGYGTEEEFAQLKETGNDAAGKIALVEQYGPEGMTSSEKFANAEAAGAVGCVFWFTEPFNYGVAVAPSTIPTCIIQDEMGQTMSELGGGTLRANPNSVVVPIDKEDKLYLSTSWGTDETLELKPEIMAPGESIYSSFPSETHDQYVTFSGTSMATPHITGAVALLNQWYEEEGNTLAPKGVKRADYFENLMMSTSTIVKQENGTPYSPRRQSAGLLNLENAVRSPVILLGDDGKTKLSLMDGLESEFTLAFQAQNTSSDTAASYDQVRIYTMTDGYAEEGGETYVDGTVLLQETTDEIALTLVPGAVENLTYTVSLDQAKLDENMEHFPNGYYIDGYVELSDSEDAVPPVHIPFMGFYGDWLAAPLFDGSLYNGDYTAEGTRLITDLPGDRQANLGYNLLTGELAGEGHIAFSPNGDGIFDRLAVGACLLRGALALTWELRDADGNVVATAQGENVSKFYVDDVQVFDLPEDLPDGEYTVTGSGYHYYDKDKKHPYAFGGAIPVVVDTQAPEITSAQITTEDGRTYASVSASDNYCLQLIALSIEGQPEKEDWARAVDKSTETVKFDITGYEPEDLTIEAADDAMNPIAVPFSAFLAPDPPSGGGGGGSTTSTKTEKNEDGSTTRTVTNSKTGDVTATTTYPDGTKIVATTPKNGETTIEVTVPKDKESVIVTIPTAAEPKPGEVAVIVREDGTKEMIKTSVATADGIKVLLSESCKLEIVDNSKRFADVGADHWAAEAVSFVTSRELFTGGDGGFLPAGDMSRAMLFTVLARLDGQETTGGDTWYSAAMDWAKETGVSDGTAPEQGITREQLAVMLYRYAVGRGLAPAADGALTRFNDADEVSDWATDAMLWAVNSGILQGSDNKLNPNGATTRAEVAVMLQRFISNMA